MDSTQHVSDERLEELFSFVQKITKSENLFRHNFLNSRSLRWYKSYDSDNNKFRMLFINKQFSNVTGIHQDAYFGREDDMFWGNEEHSIIYNNDMSVLHKKIPIHYEESLKNLLNGKEEIWAGWRFPEFCSKSSNSVKKVVGVHGEAIVFPKDMWNTFSEDTKQYILGL